MEGGRKRGLLLARSLRSKTGFLSFLGSAERKSTNHRINTSNYPQGCYSFKFILSFDNDIKI